MAVIGMAMAVVAPPPEASLPGRMTGGGSIIAGMRITHGMELNCDAAQNPQNLEINWPGHRFHLQQMISATCSLDPFIDPAPPQAGFNTYKGSGIGRINGVSGAHIDFTFTDAGEPGTSDTAIYTIKDASDTIVFTASGILYKGNQQAHDQ